MKVKTVLKALVLIVIVLAAVIAFFSYDVVEDVTIVSDIPHIQTVCHLMKNNKKVDVTVSDSIENVSEGVYKLGLLIQQNQSSSTASYEVKNMKAVISLPKDTVIVSAVCNDANERFTPRTSYLGNKLEIICESTVDYLDIELIIQGSFTQDPEISLSYDLYGKGMRILSRFIEQQQQLTVSLQQDSTEG